MTEAATDGSLRPAPPSATRADTLITDSFANAYESARHPVMSSVFKTADGALAFRGGFDSHALSPTPAPC